LARAFGATQVLDARAESFEQQLADLRAREIHTVVDCTGTQQGLDTSTKLLRPGGRLILFGWNHGRASFDGDAWHLGGLTVINAAPNSHIRKVFEPAIRLMAAGIINLEPLVTHVVPLEEAADLLRRVTEGQEPDYIKGVVRL
jgi:L-iditol 2-dehydrogenase